MFKKFLNYIVGAIFSDSIIAKILLIIVFTIYFTFFSLFVTFLVSPSSDTLVYIFLGFELVIPFFILVVILGPFLEKRFNLWHINNHIGGWDIKNPSIPTFECWIITLLLYSLYPIVLFFFIGYAFNNFILGIGLGLSFSFPIWVMFLRRETFSDKEIDVFNNDILGFHPFYYLFLSSICGLVLLGYSFNVLSFSLINEGNIGLSLVLIVFSLAFISLILFPDKLDSYFSFNIIEKKGFFKYFAIVIILLGIFRFILSLIVDIGV